tara:strand:- start:55 stop:513 length:459 start_codon:yes stop_codon:yes gene_type:complete
MRSLIEAYRNTTFRIELPEGEVSLRPDSPCRELNRFLAKNRWDHAAVITAFNPGSIERTREENDRANHELEMRISDDGHRFFRGVGEGNDADWHPEDSYLVCGIALKPALKLAEAFGQYAIAFHTLGQETSIELTEIANSFLSHSRGSTYDS